MSRTPLISIVIPAYKCERILPATLQSIQTQSLRDWECIIVDDGSPDGTLEIARQWASDDDRFHAVAQKNAGACNARNYGYTKTDSGSRYLNFMDADDLFSPGALQSLFDASEASPEMAGSHGLADFIDEEGAPLEPGEFAERSRKRIGLGEDGRLQDWDLSKPTSFRTLLYYNTVFPPGVVLTRRPYYEKAGPWDPAMTLVEDWDMLIRLARHGSFSFVNQVVVLYRRHRASLTLQSHEANMRRLRQLQHKAFRSRENTPGQRAIARKIWRGIQMECMRGKLETARRRLADGKFAGAGAALIRTYVEIHRFLRGYPTPRGL